MSQPIQFVIVLFVVVVVVLVVVGVVVCVCVFVSLVVVSFVDFRNLKLNLGQDWVSNSLF